MEQLSELFDSYGGPGQDAPLSALPDLIEAFERRRAIELLTSAEKEQVAAFAASAPDQRVGVNDFVAMLQAMGAGASSLPANPASAMVSSSVPAPIRVPDSGLFTTTMLSPDEDLEHRPTPSDGSPAPRKRPSSALSRSRIPVSSANSSATSSLQRLPTETPPKLIKRRSLLSMLAASPTSTKFAAEDLTQLVAARGVTYLGVALDGPYGSDFNAIRDADKLSSATKGVGVSRWP